jgi:hypothetical protein
MPSSVMSPRMALVRPDVSEKRSASIISVTKIDELETTLALTSNRRIVFLRSAFRSLVTANVLPSSPILVTLMMDAKQEPQL